MNNIIVISGKQFSGKDTLAKILLEKLSGYRRIGIGDAIKLEYGKRNNLSFEQIEQNKSKYRQDLIELGNYGRNIDEDFWLKNLAGFDKIIVPDVRVSHEADFFKDRGAFLVRVESDYDNRSKRGTIVNNDDYTETALDDYPFFNIIVENNSSYEDLKKEADKVINLFLNFIG